MAAYGRGQMLGTGIDPRLMTMDYSPFVDAAATQAKGIATLGANIGGAIAQVGDYKKQQAEDERLVQKSKSVAKAIGDLIPDLQPTIQESMMILDDKELPLSRRKAEAEAISDILNLGINEVSNRQEIALKQRQLGLQEADLIQRANTAMLPEPSKWKPYDKTFEAGGVNYNVTGFIDQNGFFKRADGRVFSSVMDAISTPVGESGDGMVLQPKGEEFPAEEFPDAVPIEGTPISPSLIEGVPTPLDESVYNTIPSLPGEVIQNIEAAGTFRPSALPPGVSITEPTSEGKTYTIDELKELKNQGVKFNAQPAKEEGKFTLTSISPATQPQGRTTRFNPETNEFEIIEGPGAGASKEERQAKAKGIAEKRGFDSILGSSIQSLGKIDRALAENPVLAAGQGILSKVLPATDVGELSVMFENMRNETSKATLFELKEITGAVGQTTEKEWPRYESRFGKIEVGMKPEQIKNNIKLNTLNAFEAVNGSPDKMLKLLEEGKATQEQFDSYVDSYKAIRDELGIPNQGVLGYKTDWSRFEDKLVDKYTGRNPAISRERPSTGLTPQDMQFLESRPY